MNLSKFYTSGGRVISVFFKGKYCSAFIKAVPDLQSLFKLTALLPTNISLSERLYCYNNNIKFVPRCLVCGQQVSFHDNAYRRYCSDTCASKDRSSFYVASDDTRKKISDSMSQRNYEHNLKLLDEWKKKAIQSKPLLDFSKFDWQPYKNHKSTVICKIHGERELSISYLKDSISQGCDLCSQNLKGKTLSISKSKSSFLKFKEYMEEYRPEQYSQLQWEFIPEQWREITLRCDVHGLFNTTPHYLMNSEYECPKCGLYHGSRKSPLTMDIIKKYVYEMYGDTIQVLSNVYTGVFDRNIEINCSKHGLSITNADMLLRSKFGCKQCGRENHAEQKSYSLDDVNQKLAAKHEHVKCIEYVRSGHKTSKFECSIHGVFENSYASVISSDYGCPDCVPVNTSKGENEVRDFVETLGFQTRTDKSNGWHLDVVIDSRQVAIEYNRERFHSEQMNRGKHYHRTKTVTCRNKGIFLLHVWESQWVNPIKQEIIKSMIRSKLNVISEKIHARKCEIVDLSTDSTTVQEFLEFNHIQGRTGTQVVYGLQYDGELVSVMTFSKVNGEWNLTRFANKINTVVNGSFSKLLKHFEKEHNPTQIDTFADLMYSYGDVYRKHGFDEIYESESGYFYFYNDKRYHRSSFMKSKIAERFNLTSEYVQARTETDLIYEFGIYRIWDSGKIKFTKFL